MLRSKQRKRFVLFCTAIICVCIIFVMRVNISLISARLEINNLKKQLNKEDYSNKFLQTAIKTKAASDVKDKSISDNKINVLQIKSDLSDDQNKLLTDEVAALKDYILKQTGRDIVNIKRAKFEVTMYTTKECGKAVNTTGFGKTASGTTVSRGSVAMPTSIPFGSQVIIDGVTEDNNLNIVHTVEDTGGAIVEKTVDGETVYKLDVYTTDLQEALNWGVREKEGWIYYVKK